MVFMIPAPMIVSGAFVAALILLIVQLSRSFGALRVHAIDYDRGFAPIMVLPVSEKSDVSDKRV